MNSFHLITGDCREIMTTKGPFDLIIADPPYADTTLAWDRRVHGWLKVAHSRLKPTGSLWLFGSLRSYIGSASAIASARFRVAQDIVWEKPNGTGFAADRFKRVHEHVVQLYKAGEPWSDVYNDVQRMPATTKNKSTRVLRPDRVPHGGSIAPVDYVDDGTRIVRSVIRAPSVRGGLHPTEKPISLLEILIRTSCPPSGVVGDFFAGSGAVGEACVMTGRQYIGTEIDSEMAAKARIRLGDNLFSGAAA